MKAKPRQDNGKKIATGCTCEDQFSKYHFKNVIFGSLKDAEPRVRKPGFRGKVSGLDAHRLHFPDPKNSNRLTVPRGIVDECKLKDLHEYALGFESPGIAWNLVLVPLRGRAFETMYTGRRDESPAFPTCPGGRQELQLFQWESTLIAEQEEIYTFLIPDYYWFPKLFFWREKVSFGQTSTGGTTPGSYSVQIPDFLRLSPIECDQISAAKQRTGFAMAYDAIGNLILFRQPLNLFRKLFGKV